MDTGFGDFGGMPWTAEEIAAWWAQHDVEVRASFERERQEAAGRPPMVRTRSVECRPDCGCGCATYDGGGL